MKFKINLKPYPGEPYFTVREHRAKFDGSLATIGILDEIEQVLRALLRIPDDRRLNVLSVKQKSELLNMIQPSIILDDPTSGVRLADFDRDISHQVLHDLSFSLPYIPDHRAKASYHLVDPNASLGVPCECIFVFSKVDLPIEQLISESDEDPRDLYVLRGVLNDLADKGDEQSLREANYKAAVLYQLIESHSELMPAAEKAKRSKTCISAICDASFRTKVEQLGYEFFVSSKDDNEQITIANYPTHSKESIEMFADRVAVI